MQSEGFYVNEKFPKQKKIKIKIKEIIKTICDSVNHTRFPKDDHLPDWARRDNRVTKSDRVDLLVVVTAYLSGAYAKLRKATI